MPAARERTEERKHSLVAPTPPGARGPGPVQGTPNPNWETLGKIYGAWETRAAHTQ